MTTDSIALLNIDCLGKELRLEGTTDGQQQLFLDNRLVSVKPAPSTPLDLRRHEFSLTPHPPEPQVQDGPPPHITLSLEVELIRQPLSLNYRLKQEDKLLAQGQRTAEDLAQQRPQAAAPRQKIGFIGLASLGIKLLKSAKVIQVVLAGASVAAYSWLFSFHFALALIACLMFHEYGHIRAMKYFGLKTKGIYLIPFMGGLALSDDKLTTRWQDVMIAIMGPTFGVLMSLLALVAYWLTANPVFAGLAAFNALLNLFNLLPILPLDGGHILKSISFSMNSMLGLVACVAGAAIGVLISYQLGLALLGFLLLIGSMEIIFEWQTRKQSRLLPLDRYGQIFSSLWYLLTIAALVAIIWHLAGSGDDMLGLPLKILQS